MADLGERLTDAGEERIRSELERIYTEASNDLHKKASDFLKRHYAKDEQKRKDLAAGKITKEEYRNWQIGQVFIGKQWQSKIRQMARGLVDVEKEAVRIVHGEQISCFADNTNYMEFRIDKDHDFGMNFSLYDTHTVTMLIRDEPELLRRRYVDGEKCEAWNVKTIRNCIIQGILQGESIPDIAKRMARDTASTDMKAMTRYARTAMTGAQNAGRLQAMRESNKQGIVCLKLWMATGDDRTRDAHAELDGHTSPVDKPFESILGPIMFPGDPNASDENVWNCRCALGYQYPDNAESVSIYGEEYDGEEEEFDRWEDAENIIIPSSRMHPELSYASNYFKGVVDEDNDYRNEIKSMDYQIQDVKISELYTDQNTNKVADIRKMLILKVDEPVVVIYKDNKYILLDGNTRSAAAMLKGKKTIRAKVYKK